MYWCTEYVYSFRRKAVLFLRRKVMSPLQISKSSSCHAWSCFMMMNWPKWLLCLRMIWTDFVAEVKDKDSKVGETLCDYDVMTKCCVMSVSGRAGQSQSTSRELWLTGKCSVAAWHSHSEHGDTGDAGGRDDQGVSDPGDPEVPGGDQQGGGRERQVLPVEDAEGIFKDSCVAKIDKCNLHRKFVGRSE